MTVRKLLITSYSVIAICASLVISLSAIMHHNNHKLEEAEIKKYQSYLLADELRQSSDDLTRFARTYVVSGDPKYEKMYWHVLAIRNGEKPRPQEYNRIYWDLVLNYGDKPRPDGKMIPLRKLMKEAGFTEEEFGKLQEAQNNSDDLVTTETIAMNAVKGLYDDGTGNYTRKGEPDFEMARRIMHDEKYHQNKASIMRPIDEFFQLFQERTIKQLEQYQRKEDVLIGMTQALSILLVLFSIIIGLFTTRKILNQVGGEPADIAKITEKVASGDLDFEFDDKKEATGVYAAIQAMLRNLKQIQIEREAQSWVKTGQAQLNSLMSGEQEVTTLAKSVISFLTTYVNAQVGLFYLLQEPDSENREPFLEIIASYAYVADEDMRTQFNIGEGLVGQVALERKIIIRIHESQEFTHIIQSGLAQAVPNYVILLPFLYESSVRGVIEIASSHALTEAQQNFLKQAMPIIGIAVNTTESRDKMQELLHKTQAQSKELQGKTEELQRQQGELQQSNEELQVQSEELQTQQEELRQSNEELEARTRDLEQQKSEINKKNKELEKSKQLIQAKAKEVELASKYKSEFLANMSHELRTPLNSLLILAQILSENRGGNLTEKQVGYTKTIHSAGSDLLTLINEILDLSKVEAGRIEIHIESLSIGDLIEATEHKFKHMAEEKGLQFKVSMSEDFPQLLQTDSHRLQQIINNLLSNALKFTETGSITLSLFRPTDHIDNIELKTDKILAVTVSDTGIGIPAEKQQVIFEAFQQADGTTSRKYGGTGLGLSISRQLARLLGGDLVLESGEGKGSTFILYLPENPPKVEEKPIKKYKPTAPQSIPQIPKEKAIRVIEVEKQPEAQAVEKQGIVEDEEYKDDRHDLKPEDKSILLIEDDRKFLDILVGLVRERDFKVIVAEDGTTGLHLAETYKPNAIILDVGLPKLDGWSVMERLKNNPTTRHIPVHFMSASDQSQDAKRMGAIGYLSKPVNMGQLDEAFENIESFIAKKVKKVLLVSKRIQRKQQILDLIEGKDVTVITVDNQKDMRNHLQNGDIDCMIIDTSSEKKVCTTILKQFIDEDNSHLSHIPIIVYADRELTHEEEVLLKRCENRVTIKSVHSPERLLDETTLFLHQLEAKLSKEKQKMLRLVHDKEAILENKKVLIVDDDIRNTFALMSFLEGKNMEVIVANHGKEALELLADKENQDIAVILMDIMMPEMDGYETMRKIRELPQLRKLPIIALTAKAMKGDKGKCIEAGANDYVPKPVDTDKLLSLMRVWLYR